MSGETPVRDPDRLLTPSNAAVVFIDYQPEQVRTIGSQPVEVMMLNAVAVARAAQAFKVPVVLSTVGVELGVNTATIAELADALPEAPEVDRSTLNSWEDPDFPPRRRGDGAQEDRDGWSMDRGVRSFPDAGSDRRGL